MELIPLFRSFYTFYSGLFNPSNIPYLAKENGYFNIVLADKNGIYGFLKFYKAAKECGLNPLCGVELTHPQGEISIFLIGKGINGYKSICRLITKRNLFPSSFNFEEEISKESENLFILSNNSLLIEKLLKSGCERNSIFIRLKGNKREDEEALKRSEKLNLKKVFAPLFALKDEEGLNLHKILRKIKHKNGELYHENLLIPKSLLKAKFDIGCELNVLYNSSLELNFRDFLTPKMDENSAKKLRKLAFKGLAQRIKPISSLYLKRLLSELEVIEKLGYCDYFLLVHDIVKIANEMGLYNIGRGSGASSLVSFSLFLTHIDPVKNNLYFERFLNLERKNFPDIDLDFASSQRDILIEKLKEKYGEEKFAMISTHNTFSMRSAFREIAKAFGIEEEEIDEVAKVVPSISSEKLKIGFKLKPEARKVDFSDSPWKEILTLATQIDHFPRHLSIHCGGIVISSLPLTERISLERAQKGIPITQYDMFDVEEVGLIKTDILGNRSLSLLYEAVATIEKEKSIKPQIFPPERTYSDLKTISLISQGKTMGCFYIESPAMRQLLKRLKTKSFEELTIASSIIRPGVAESGMMESYIRRATGKEETKYIHPKLKEILSETRGVMVYQEDVLRVVNEFIGLSLSEADLIRRAMSGKYRCADEMEKLSKRFFEKGRERGISESILSELWEQISSFAGYAFCKAHSASFAQLSFQCTFLKAHFPNHFFSALINNQGGFYPTSAYIEEARRWKLKIYPPDINRAEEKFIPEKDGIRCGLIFIKGIKRRLIEKIIEERNEQPFVSLSDLLLRLKGFFTLKEIEKLILSGALDSFAPHRGKLLYLLEISQGDGKKVKSLENGKFHPFSPPPSPIPSLKRAFKLSREAKSIKDAGKPLSLVELLEGERNALSFCITAHPLTPYIPFIRAKGITLSKDLKEKEGKNIKVFGQIITYKKLLTSKNKEGMAFVTLEDPTGLMELTFFPKSYSLYGHLLMRGYPIIVEGIIDRASELNSIQVDKVKILPYFRLQKSVEEEGEVA